MQLAHEPNLAPGFLGVQIHYQKFASANFLYTPTDDSAYVITD